MEATFKHVPPPVSNKCEEPNLYEEKPAPPPEKPEHNRERFALDLTQLILCKLKEEVMKCVKNDVQKRIMADEMAGMEGTWGLKEQEMESLKKELLVSMSCCFGY